VDTAVASARPADLAPPEPAVPRAHRVRPGPAALSATDSPEWQAAPASAGSPGRRASTAQQGLRVPEARAGQPASRATTGPPELGARLVPPEHGGCRASPARAGPAVRKEREGWLGFAASPGSPAPEAAWETQAPRARPDAREHACLCRCGFRCHCGFRSRCEFRSRCGCRCRSLCGSRCGCLCRCGCQFRCRCGSRCGCQFRCRCGFPYWYRYESQSSCECRARQFRPCLLCLR